MEKSYNQLYETMDVTCFMRVTRLYYYERIYRERKEGRKREKEGLVWTEGCVRIDDLCCTVNETNCLFSLQIFFFFEGNNGSRICNSFN